MNVELKMCCCRFLMSEKEERQETRRGVKDMKERRTQVKSMVREGEKRERRTERATHSRRRQ